ncbi:sugar O-acetyltransferase [Bifidobacterium gallicum]|uniref:Acetyltransferase n=1 Tax=Bifidobacterium gallicum DSM 20093 = LMG 11596 TaxID=561180 RepID=D1NUY5_9BIFI|nr:sugar O-acetyltransferase [Bifidobacterium gallicum]EFA22636.1 bacterial transferase hexapeptide repeat protein [Bifidobacterium gallicum DSM 20093 = LMG 11596]KFI59607.1 acetyltransferase [Bifidobacterium gallicum DSM 20093 = LMG 11596]
MDARVEEALRNYPDDDDLRRLFEGEPTQYRKSMTLPRHVAEAARMCSRINAVYYDNPDEAYRLFHEFVPGAGEGVQFTPRFEIEYGMALTIGRGTFLNKDFMICGGGLVTIGEDCLIGPRCTINTPNHALDVHNRLDGWEHALPVVIGNNVWFGSNVTVCPGASVGDNTIIGAGSVVVGDIPANTIAAGNPCNIIRPLPEIDPFFA